MQGRNGIVSANGKAKVKGCFTPNYNHKYEKMGNHIMRQLHKERTVTVHITPMSRQIIIMLVRMGMCKKTEVFADTWLVERVVCINYEPKIKSGGLQRRG